jgi:hypothetical protein
MPSRARLVARVPVSAILASVAILAFTAPGSRAVDGPPTPDPVAAFKNPTGIAVGSDGRVYISSQGDSSVVVYAPGARGLARPIRRIGPGSGLVSPEGIALDSRGGLLVASGQHRTVGKGSITVYAPGATGDAAPVRVIAGVHTGLDQPSAIAVGPRGRLIVVNGPRTNVVNSNGIMRGVGSEVLVFDATAAGDARPAQALLDIIDTIVRPPPAPAPPIRVRTDTVCGGPPPPPSGGSRVCQIVERTETPAPFLQSAPVSSSVRQSPDTIRPLDVTASASRLLVLTSRGVTRYDRALARGDRAMRFLWRGEWPRGRILSCRHSSPG